MLFLFLLFQCLCSDTVAELCPASGSRKVQGFFQHLWERTPSPSWTEALAVHSGCSSRTNLTHINSCLLGCYFFIVSFLVTERTVDFPCPPHSVEFPGGIWSWDILFGSKCVFFPKQTGFPSRTQCYSEEGLFPRCTELAPPSSKPDKARSVPRGVKWAVCQEVHFKDWL